MASPFEIPDIFPASIFSEDLALRELYMKALNRALQSPDIRDGFDYVTVKPLHIRLEMMRDGEEILAAAPDEYNVYLLARDRVRRGLDKWFDLLILAILDGRIKNRLAEIGYMMTIAGGGSSLISAFAGWGNAWPFVAPTLLAGGLVLLASWASGLPGASRFVEVLHRLVRPLAFLPGSGWFARRMLIAKVEESELAAQIRLRINTRRAGRFDHGFRVVGHPELGEAFDSAYRVPTRVTRELDDLLGHLSNASIGIAGPRGSGKSTLIQRYCGEPAATAERGDLRCLVSAPVEYAPRDFVLHLFATFCRRSLRYLATVGRPPFGSRLTRVTLAYWLVAWGVTTWPDEALSTLITLVEASAPLLGQVYETVHETVSTSIPPAVADELFGIPEGAARPRPGGST